MEYLEFDSLGAVFPVHGLGEEIDESLGSGVDSEHGGGHKTGGGRDVHHQAFFLRNHTRQNQSGHLKNDLRHHCLFLKLWKIHRTQNG